MLAFSNDYYGFIFRVTQSVELFCTYAFATCISYFTVYIFRSWHIRKYIIINIFKVRHLVSFAIVILMGFTMYIDSIVGQVFLLIEFVLLLILFKEYIGAMYNMCKNILLRNKHKR